MVTATETRKGIYGVEVFLNMVAGLVSLAWAVGVIIAGLVLFPEAMYLSDKLLLAGTGYAAFFPLWVLLTCLGLGLFSVCYGFRKLSFLFPKRVNNQERIDPEKERAVRIGKERYFNAHWMRLLWPIVCGLGTVLLLHSVTPIEWGVWLRLMAISPLLILFMWGFWRALSVMDKIGKALWEQQMKEVANEE